MKYMDALKRVERWLKETGVRRYCRDVCGGECCKALDCSERCRRPPLTYSLFLCEQLLTKFNIVKIAEWKNIFLEVCECINPPHFNPEEFETNVGMDIPDESIEKLMKKHEKVNWMLLET